MKRIGLVGARGHTGRELIRLLAQRDDLALAFAVSRSSAGRPVTELAPEADPSLVFEALTPEDITARGADAVILAMPNGAAADYVAAIEAEAPDTVIVDLSADYRFDEGWVYGLPEVYGRDQIKGAKRIANPGCYATAGQLAVWPMASFLAGPAHLFGVSGYSGAGTTPSRKNDTEALKDNLMPYGLVEHMHEREMTRHLGHDVRFSPHVAAFFRGITLTAQVEFKDAWNEDDLFQTFDIFYAGNPLISVQWDAPEIRGGAFNPGAVIGGFAISDDGMRGVMVTALDNLLKGAAVQCIQNLSLALGLEELRGIVDAEVTATEPNRFGRGAASNMSS